MPETTAQTIDKKAPTTGRSAELIAGKHGFEDLAKLAETLPHGARVLDVGAGASPFGREVTALRPDILWTNFDYSYRDPAILDEVSAGAPGSIKYAAGDAMKLVEVYEPESFDAVFSYWLLPHLSIDEIEPARQVARGIFAVTKPGGLMSVGPKSARIRLGNAVQVVKDEDLTSDEFVNRIVAATRLPQPTRWLRGATNEVTTQFFGTSRYMKRGDRHVRRVYHPETGSYVSALSPRGISTFGHLAIAMARHAARHNK